MFRKYKKRSSNPLFVIFRLLLSLTMFTLLIAGGYSAYKHFSGLDPLKLDPQSVFKNILEAKSLITNPIHKSGEGLSNNNVLGTQNQPLFKFMLVADSHNDNENLKKAILQAKSMVPEISFIIGLGDYTDVGTLPELKNAKNVLDLSGLRYFLIAGDHDLWDARDKQEDPKHNFSQVFGPLYQSFSFNNYEFLLLDNSDNYKGISETQRAWIIDELERAKAEKGIFVFIHEPLYHPSSDHAMGKVQKDLKPQAESLIFQLKGAGVKKIFSGDIHYFSEYEEPVTKLPMLTVGALVTDRNPQAPRFAIVSVYKDGTSKVEDIEVK